MRLSRLDALLAGVEPSLRRSLNKALEYIAQELKFGVPAQQVRSLNHGMVYFTGNTSSVPDREFALAHGLGVVLYLTLPVLPLGEVGAKLVNLTVTRAADAQYLYLSSPEPDAPIWLLVEGG